MVGDDDAGMAKFYSHHGSHHSHHEHDEVPADDRRRLNAGTKYVWRFAAVPSLTATFLRATVPTPFASARPRVWLRTRVLRALVACVIAY